MPKYLQVFMVIATASITLAAFQILVNVAYAQHYPSNGGQNIAVDPYKIYDNLGSNNIYLRGVSNVWGWTTTPTGAPGDSVDMRFGGLIVLDPTNISLKMHGTNRRLQMATGAGLSWSSTTDATANTSAMVTYDGSAGNGIAFYGNSGATVGAHLLMKEKTAPAAPGADNGLIYAEDLAGKTRLCALFNTGVAQCFATQP